MACKARIVILMTIVVASKASYDQEYSDVDYEATMDDNTLTDTTEEPFESTVKHFESPAQPDDQWLTNAVKDIAYYLRNHKFNEWERRCFNDKTDRKKVGFYATFPLPPVNTLHDQVYTNCEESLVKCIVYLQSVIQTCPIMREDDVNQMMMRGKLLNNDTLREAKNIECLRALQSTDVTGFPFDCALERFRWRTTASYYMCWYTMLENPILSTFEEPCDNFANCHDKNIGIHNKDPRADENVPFACAKYSFCPDPCCPMKHIKSYDECYNNEMNPCFSENAKREQKHRTCYWLTSENRNFDDLIADKWNVSCQCQKKGFVWMSEFGMCVDVNECITGEHNCDSKTENCFNLIGSFKCVCRWDHNPDPKTGKCLKSKLLKKKQVQPVHRGLVYNLKNILKRILIFLFM